MLTIDTVAALLCGVVIVYAFHLGARVDALLRDIHERNKRR